MSRSPSSFDFRLRAYIRVAALVLPTTVLAFACGGDENAAPEITLTPATDAAPDRAAPNAIADASTDAVADRRETSTPPGGATSLTLVNAIGDLGPSSPLSTPSGGTVQLCFGITNAVYPGRPMPETRVLGVASVPGVPIGLGASVSPTDNLEPYRLTPYLLNAERLAARDLADGGVGWACDALFRNRDAGALIENVDYWRFQDLLAGALPANRSVLAIVTGCAGDSTLSTTECGAGFMTGAAGLGTLQLRLFQLDSTTSAGNVGAQIVHAAPSLASEVVQPVFLTNGIAGDTVASLANAPMVYPQVSLAPPVFASVDTMASRFAYRGPTDAGAAALPKTLVDVAAISDVPSFEEGKTYTFVVLGNKNATMESLATRALHYVAVLNMR